MPIHALSFAGKPVVLKVDNLIIRYDPNQSVDPGLAQHVAELTGGQTLDDLYQAQLAQEASRPESKHRTLFNLLKLMLSLLRNNPNATDHK